MKQVVLLFTICIALSFGGNTQTVLNKDETITYIQNKMDEALKSDFKETGDSRARYCWQEKISIEGTGVTLFHSINNSTNEFGTYTSRWTSQYGENTRFYDCDYKKYITTMKFNPANIVDIFLDPSLDPGKPVGRMKIILSSRTVKKNVKTIATYGKENLGCLNMDEMSSNDTMEDFIYVYFMHADPSNFNKLKKAFEHLRDLYKADDDPFGN